MRAYSKQNFFNNIQNPESVRRALQKLNGAMFRCEEQERLVPDVELAQKLLGVAETAPNPANRQLALEVFGNMTHVSSVLAENVSLVQHVTRISITDADASVRFTAYEELSRLLKMNAAANPVTDAAMNVLKPYAADPDARIRFDALHTFRLLTDKGQGYAQEILALANGAVTSLRDSDRWAGQDVRNEILGRNPDLSSVALAKDLARSSVTDPDDLVRSSAQSALEKVLYSLAGAGAVALAEVKAVIWDPMAPRHQDYEMRVDEQKTLAVILQASPGLKDHAAALVNDGLQDDAREVRAAARESLQPKEPSFRTTCSAGRRRGLGC